MMNQKMFEWKTVPPPGLFREGVGLHLSNDKRSMIAKFNSIWKSVNNVQNSALILALTTHVAADQSDATTCGWRKEERKEYIANFHLPCGDWS